MPSGNSNKTAIRNLVQERYFTSIVEYPRDPTETDIKNPYNGQRFIPGTFARNTETGNLWYLSQFTSGDADWRKLADAEGSVTILTDQVDTQVLPNDDGEINISGRIVDNGATPSGIPLETVADTHQLELQLQIATALGSSPVDRNDAGICSFDSSAFSVSSNGFVTLTGGSGPAIDGVNIDFSTIPGTNPVVADNFGRITLTGAPVQWGVNTNAPIGTKSHAANSITIEVQAANSISTNPSDMFDAGICSFDSDAFDVDANGFVQLIGSGVPIVDINIDASTLPGTDPVTPDGSGSLQLTGAQVAAGTIGANAIRTNSLAENAIRIEVQRSAASGSSSVNNAGVCSFDSTAFGVDANGYVTLAGGAGPAIDGVTVDASTGPGTNPVGATSGGLITVTGGQVASGTIGANAIRTNSLAANTYKVEVQRSATAGSSSVNNAGICSFDSSKFTIDSNGWVSMTGGAGLTAVNVQTVTATGAFTYTPTSGMEYVIVELCGGGGGSGGTAATTGTIALAQGGSGAAYAKFLLTAAQVGASLTGSVGAGGTGGSAGNNAGNNGGDTTLATSSAWTAAGGDGGNGGASAASATVNGVGGGAVTTGTGTLILNINGGDSGPGAAAAATVLMGSAGGDCFLGPGGKAIFEAVASNSSQGTQGVGYGSGAAGAVSFGTTIARAGGDGKDGIAIFTEFI